MSKILSGLVAYPSNPTAIGRTIINSLEKLRQKEDFSKLLSWEEADIPGKFIATEVLLSIENGTVFIADISRLNFNVVFEVGYAIGCKKRTVLIRNKGIKPDLDLIRQVGIFDTLGYKEYEDSNKLSEIVSEIIDLTPIHFDEKDMNGTAPIYMLLPLVKGDTETHLIARIKKARLVYRSFDPAEQIRLSAPEAIEGVASSHGVVIPLLPNYATDVEVHNYRAAFVAGLAQGMGKPLLLLQSGTDPIPLDYRDLVSTFTSEGQIDGYVAGFAVRVTESLQAAKPIVLTEPSNFLSRIKLGASSAENEFQDLGNYYIETDEFRRALRGEIQVIIGRKGSGKTALFFQVRDRLRANRNSVILDLKPEGFQLIKFKEQVLDYLQKGSQEHTITAFWEYLLLLEICHKVLENDKDRHTRDKKLYEPYQNLESIYSTDEYISEGDFAERMLKLTGRIAEDFDASGMKKGTGIRLKSEDITQFIYKHNIGKLRSELVEYLKYKEDVWILFDNLDKGWPPHGITPEDALNLRCLLEAVAKLERLFRREHIQAKGIIFVRNDVYEQLVDITPDRGKISHALVDWTDEELLLELLRRRFIYSIEDGDPPFQSIWHKICVSHINGEETAHYMVDRCLMRPRSLIDFLLFCRSYAVNLGHHRIEVEDIENGEEQYSTQLVHDISYEIKDIFPPAKDVLYEFIECPSEFNRSLLASITKKISRGDGIEERLVDLLLWYGVVGFKRSEGEATYIYSVRYDMKRLKALLESRATSKKLIYTINPAFWRGLEVVR